MADSQSDSNIFSVRIVSIDYYMAPPIPGFDVCYSSFQGGKVNEVPVIRIYGSTPAGQKTCLHIHQALPYLYVPCSDISLNPQQEGDAYTNTISLALERALKLKGNAGSKRQHVHDCSLVRARRFYGYHPSEELFLKIYLYYPHDVSRAANLLLGGAILDKSLQPYESHIPFILQFLVDYNLCGMGHVHLSQMKFRHPVPDVFSPRRSNGQCSQEIGELNWTAADIQADSSGGTSFSSPIWISSTIPDAWMWHHFSESALSGPHIHYVKRQSVCELEGDTTVNDILNQQFKMCTSLSQTCMDVKMVQSLIPIWEEEYERTGMREVALPPDPGKPLPEDVLKTLSCGLEFEHRLAELCNEAEYILTSSQNDAKPVLSVASSTDGEILVALTHVNPENAERNIIGSLSAKGLPCEEEVDAMCSELKDVDPKSLSVGEVRSFEMSEPSDSKAADVEALGLLKWLACSQAAEDINSDDELVRETILSPLLPATTIDKVLEKANMEYESESQKECQDILDSVENFIDLEFLKERATPTVVHNHDRQTFSNKKIPQLDGSTDDPYVPPSTGSTEKSLERYIEIESEKTPQLMLHDTSTGITSKHKNNKSLWGSLPFSMTQKMNDLETVSSDRLHTCTGENKQRSGASFLAGNDIGSCSDTLVEHADKDACDMKVASPLVGSSVRDLMRRKRSYRLESPECVSVKVKKTLAGGEQMEDTLLCPKHDVHETVASRPTYSDFSTYDMPPLPFSHASAIHARTPLSTVEREVLCSSSPKIKRQDSAISIHHGETYIGKEAAFRVTSAESTDSDVYTSKSGSLSVVQLLQFDGKDKPTTDERLQELVAAGSSCFSATTILGVDSQIQTCCEGVRTSLQCEQEMSNSKPLGMGVTTDMRTCTGEQVGDAHLAGLGSSLPMVVCMGEETTGLIGMTLSKKTPILDGDVVVSQNDSYTPTTLFHYSHVDEENYEGTSGRLLDEILPFFAGDCQGEKGVQNGCLTNIKYNDLHQEAVMGVPTHYQNDGSFLYLLSPVFSPPSADCVSEWLLQHDGASSLCLVASQSPSPDDCNKALPDSGSVYNVRPILEPVNQENNVILNVESNADYANATTVWPNEGNVAKVNVHSDGSQDESQISGPDVKPRLTPLSQIGFRDPASVGAGQQLTLLSIEVEAETRADLRPDPRFDAVKVIALAIQTDCDSIIEVYVLLFCNDESCQRSLDGISGCKICVFSEEKQLFSHFTKIICSFDPDILMGWDIQGTSLGFLAERAAQLGIGLLNNISRTPSETTIAADVIAASENEIVDNLLPEPLSGDPVQPGEAIIEDEWGRTHASGIHVGGRVVLNVWRLMRGEVKLNVYTIEAVAETVLRRKIPSIPYKVLTKWFSSGPGCARYRCIEYMTQRAKLNLEIMNQLDMINRTSELARVFGIDFFSVLSRGSQYRVESMFLRLAHTQNYLAISPGNRQVASQPAMECLPLVMEPESSFYADPVVVLDFQSLYPSMIIAYNLCFCTCLGKVAPPQANTLGVSSFSPDLHVLRDLKSQILLTPNGVMYVPSKLRKGVLPRLLEEILSTRIMVKQAMKKLSPSQQVLHRIFNARQLALKLIANVTYGYTAAGFSGRMPCAELADSIVQCGRITLEKAISFVNANDRWKAKVVYGDTDSIFVLLKGRTVKESFEIGQEIASAITAMNPNPVTLKLEKVYHPCFLLTKKRYVGYSYESPDQIEPLFDAKGIETVRRDTCAAVSKTLEQSLRLFFEHQQISEVKAYLHRQWKRILSGRVSLQDFVFAKEVRLGSYSARVPSSLPPAAIVATKAMRADPRAEPRYAERVPYVVIHGEPGARLVDMVIDPLDLLAIDTPYRLNDLYYINKQIIPALQRVFGLVGADLNQWFSEMPRPARESFAKRPLHAANPFRTRIDYYYLSKHCVLCGELVQASAHLCNKCLQKESATAAALTGRTSKLEREMQHLAAICRHCGGGDWLVESGVKCTSLACSVFYERCKVQKELQVLSTVASEKSFYPKCMVEWF